MQPPRPTEIAHMILRTHIRPGDTVVDTTAGNSHDTIFLAETVGETGTVHAIDIQPQAIESAKLLAAEKCLQDRIVWHLSDHSLLRELIEPAETSTIVFNLGCLPGEDHKVTTQVNSTIGALRSASELLAPKGLLSVLCYPGHE